MPEPQLPEFGQDADEWHAAQGPYLHELPRDESRLSPVIVRCGAQGCREIVAVLSADKKLVTRRARVSRNTHDVSVNAPCRKCDQVPAARDAEGFLIPRYSKISSKAFWHLVDNPQLVGRQGVTRSMVAPELEGS